MCGRSSARHEEEEVRPIPKIQKNLEGWGRMLSKRGVHSRPVMREIGGREYRFFGKLFYSGCFKEQLAGAR